MIVELLIRAIEGLEHELDKAFRRLFHHYPRHPRNRYRVRQIVTILVNNQTYIPMDPIQVKIEAGPIGSAISLVDSKTLKPIPDAVMKFISRTSSDLSLATIDEQGNIVPVASGAYNVEHVNEWSYTDQNENEQLEGIRLTTLQPYVNVEKEGVLQVVAAGPAVPVPAQA